MIFQASNIVINIAVIILTGLGFFWWVVLGLFHSHFLSIDTSSLACFHKKGKENEMGKNFN